MPIYPKLPTMRGKGNPQNPKEHHLYAALPPSVTRKDLARSFHRGCSLALHEMKPVASIQNGNYSLSVTFTQRQEF